MKKIYLSDKVVLRWENKGHKYKAEVLRDYCAENPRDEGFNIAVFACWHKKYRLGDFLRIVDDGYESFWNGLVEDTFEEIMEEMPVEKCQEVLKDYYVWMPLWLYDHSGLTIRASEKNPFSDTWDSMFVGWAVVSKDDMLKYGVDEDRWRDEAYKTIKEEVEDYDAYLRGDVFTYEVYSDESQYVIDAGWKCYGDDIESAGIAYELKPYGFDVETCEYGEE